MSRFEAVRSVVETTDPVEPRRAWDFWRSTALAPHGDAERVPMRAAFRARRRAAASAGWALSHTASSPVALDFTARHVDRNAPESVVIGVGLRGGGYQEQSGRGARIAAGDISFLVRNRPFVTGTQGEYEEVRLAVPRETFEAWIGDVDAFAGRTLRADPATLAFRDYLSAFARSVGRASEGEARAAVEGALHLLRGLARDPAEGWRTETSREALRSLACAHIERRLHDPHLDPREIHEALGVSRAHLYRAFAESDGIATVIRDTRLDLAHRRLLFPGNDGPMIATIAYDCGFTDVTVFNRAFRRRFGLSPRALRAEAPRAVTAGDTIV